MSLGQGLVAVVRALKMKLAGFNFAYFMNSESYSSLLCIVMKYVMLCDIRIIVKQHPVLILSLVIIIIIL